jgi:hypothetical protein
METVPLSSARFWSAAVLCRFLNPFRRSRLGHATYAALLSKFEYLLPLAATRLNLTCPAELLLFHWFANIDWNRRRGR